MENKPRVLIIDDIQSNADMLMNLLELSDIESDCALSGKEGLRKANICHYHLFLIDIMMPEMDGFQLCTHLKSNPKTADIPVIFITGLHDHEQIKKAFEIGAVDYITKPFNYDETIARIKTHISLKLSTERIEKEFKIIKQYQKKLKESRQKYKTLFYYSSNAKCLMNFSGKIIYANDTFIDFFQYKKQELRSLKPEELVINFHHIELIINKLKTNKHIRNYEIKMQKKDGAVVDCLITFNKVKIKKKNAIITTIIDVTAQKQAEQMVRKAIVATEEKEKQKFAQDLHDGLGPLLSTAKLYLNSINENTSHDKLSYFVKQTISTLNDAITEITQIANRLSPHILQNFGLNAALQHYISKITSSSDFKINFISNITIRFPEIIEISIYRISCELITNSIKHAKATEIELNIYTENNFIVINYSDNGIGFDNNDTNSKGMGLQNIRSRLDNIEGNASIVSQPNKGFSFYANIPF